MNYLESKVIIITGASSGIGKASAKMLAAEGAKVIAVARNQERLNELVNEVTKHGD